jgi:hypothetical protein
VSHKNAKKKREKKEAKRMDDQARADRATVERVAETTYYAITPQLMQNCAMNFEKGLRKEEGLSELFTDYLHGEGRGKTHEDERLLIIAGGPSIEMFGHLDMLADAYIDRKFTIVAVDAIFPALCDCGLYPDYVISADLQEETTNFFLPLRKKEHKEAVKRHRTVFILHGAQDPSTLKITKPFKRYFYWPTAAFGKSMDASTMWNLMREFGVVNPHGHVTGAAMSMFSALRPKTMALIGADYCYRPGKTYEETFWYRHLVALGKPHEDIIEDLQPQTFIDRISGEEVMTDVVFMQYLAYMFNWLEAVKPRLNVVNCSGRGLFFDEKFVPAVAFKSFLEVSNG